VKIAHLVVCLALATLPGAVRPAQGGEERAALEAAFARTMSGATLVGNFTLDQAPEAAPQPEAYRLGKVEKLPGGDQWRFEAQIEYGGKTSTLPLVLDVKWAGDTPVITLTDLAIPLMGTFTARVVIYGERYAGIWSGADHGGQMYGRLVPAPGGEAASGAEGDQGDQGE